MLPKKTVGAKGGPALSGYENKKEEVEMEATGQKKGSAKLKKGWGMTQSGEPYFKPNSNNPTRDKKEEVEMDEKNWIQGAIKNPGSLRKSLDVPAGENIPARKLAAAAREGGINAKRANLAMTLKKMHGEYVPENGDHPPKKAHKHDKKKDKPEQGKVYALTGKSSDASIARGDSWRDSEVKK